MNQSKPETGYESLNQGSLDREGDFAHGWIGQVLDSSRNEIYVFSADSLRFQQVNKGACKNLGYSLEEMRQLTPLDLKTELGERSFAKLLEPLRSGQQDQVTFSSVHQRKNGSKYPVEVRLHLLPIDGQPVFAAVILDLTERRRVKRALQQSETRFRTLFNAAAEYIFVVDPQGTIQLTNQHVEQHGGYTREQLVGSNIKSFFTEETREICDYCFASLKKRGYSRAETGFICKHGRVLQMEFSATAIPDIDGQYTSFLIILRDVTARKRAEEAARRHLHETAHLMRLNVMGEMAAGMAHELNQPLTAMISYCGTVSDALKTLPSVPDEIEDLVRRARDQADRATQIIRHVRSFASKESIHKQPVDLNQLIPQILELSAWEPYTSETTINCDLEDRQLWIMASAVQIEQVLLNLIRNSREAIQQANTTNGKLLIETRMLPKGWIRITLSDNGPGVDADMHSRLFEPFQTSKASGLGIGLSICRSIIRDHSGELFLNRAVSNGASFIVELPAYEQHAGA